MAIRMITSLLSPKTAAISRVGPGKTNCCRGEQKT